MSNSEPEPASGFDVYGFRFHISGSAKPAIEDLCKEFSYFVCGPGPGLKSVRIELLDAPPPYDSAPPGVATVYTPRNISFRAGAVTCLDYGGRGLAFHDRAAGSFRVFSQSRDLLYEAGYLFLLSQIGEFLDSRGLHRVHALAMDLQGRAILVLLPMGGGKSTLGWSLLRFPELGFLSDDSPFVDRHGRVHAFPLHLGLLAGSETEVPPEYRRTVQRMEFAPKTLVSHEYLAHRVVPSAEPGLLFLGRRSLSSTCVIEPAGAAAGMRAMLANCVVGLGLFQGVEFLFHSDLRTLAAKAIAGWSRARNALALVRRSRVCHLTLGRDTERNAVTILEFAHHHLLDGR